MLFQAITYCLDRTSKEQHELIYNKYQFWVLKLTNQNISSTGEMNPLPPVSNEELIQCLDFFEKKLYDCITNSSQKCFWIKVAYELGYYFYLTGGNRKAQDYFSLCLGEINNDLTDLNSKTIYFKKKEEIESLLSFLQSTGIPENQQQDIVMEYHSELLKAQDSHLMESDFENFFNKISIDPKDKAIYEVYILLLSNSQLMI